MKIHPRFATSQTDRGDTVFTFHDTLDYQHSRALWEEIARSLAADRPQRRLIIDLHETTLIDSAGIALLRLLARRCHELGIPFDFRSPPQAAEYFLRYVTDQAASVPPPRERRSLHTVLSYIGQVVLDTLKNAKALIEFIGNLILAFLQAMRRPKRFRWKETLYYAQLSGAEAMPIVALLCFLMGLVMAFQAAIQLRQFGANIFVADLVSLAITRELGPIFTAVILAGRSGSAFAAEIGTMQVNEEVDALKVMGFDVTQFLVLPKVLALCLCGPLLTLLADAAGIFGGIVVGLLGLDLTMRSFLEETYGILTITDISTGLLKSLVFAYLVALIGCFRGLQASKGADSVGRQTTSAVVSGIFLIISADAVFTVVFHIFGL